MCIKDANTLVPQTTASGITFFSNAGDQKSGNHQKLDVEQHLKPKVHKVIPNHSKDTYVMREIKLS